jgi:hypothetical protein
MSDDFIPFGGTSSSTEEPLKMVYDESKNKYVIDIKDSFIDKLKDSIPFCYFIGRMNPPHPGHILILATLIMVARSVSLLNGSHDSQGHRFVPPLFLLGNGSSAEKGTFKNPIDFQIKEMIVSGLLQNIFGFRVGEDYIIEEMSYPNNTPYISLPRYINRINWHAFGSNVTIIQGAGDKEDDATKLISFFKMAKTPLNNNNKNVSCEILVFPALPLPRDNLGIRLLFLDKDPSKHVFSATIIRITIIEQLMPMMDDFGYSIWCVNYPSIHQFYGNEIGYLLYLSVIGPTLIHYIHKTNIDQPEITDEMKPEEKVQEIVKGKFIGISETEKREIFDRYDRKMREIANIDIISSSFVPLPFFDELLFKPRIENVDTILIENRKTQKSKVSKAISRVGKPKNKTQKNTKGGKRKRKTQKPKKTFKFRK